MSQEHDSVERVAGEPAARYLSFSLGAEEYAIPLLSVKEVIAIPDITPVPYTPAHFLGIMNLRGQVISVVDLRQKLGIKPEQSAETSIIICDLHSFCLGVVVDSINSVLSPSAGELAPKPDIQSSRNTDYITGIFKKDDRLVIFLNIEKTLGTEDHKAITTAPKTKAA